MAQYKATSSNSRNFTITKDGVQLGELVYPKWYTFNAEIILADHSTYQLTPNGFWDTVIQLKQGDVTLLDFKMGWKGIVLNTNIDGNSKDYLLRLKGMLSSKYVLIDSDEKELFVVDFDFKWTKFQFDYIISTSEEFDKFDHKELLLLTTLHCINYYLTFMTGT